MTDVAAELAAENDSLIRVAGARQPGNHLDSLSQSGHQWGRVFCAHW